MLSRAVCIRATPRTWRRRRRSEVEQALVQHVRNAFAGDPNVAVISTVGAPVTASVFWCRRAAFFVTPWGAGLAKYRWICNQRGLVVAGERFFHFAGHKTVHLYDLADYMEAPTPLDFISAGRGEGRSGGAAADRAARRSQPRELPREYGRCARAAGQADRGHRARGLDDDARCCRWPGPAS